MEGLSVGFLQRVRQLTRDHLNKNPSCICREDLNNVLRIELLSFLEFVEKAIG